MLNLWIRNRNETRGKTRTIHDRLVLDHLEQRLEVLRSVVGDAKGGSELAIIDLTMKEIKAERKKDEKVVRQVQAGVMSFGCLVSIAVIRHVQCV